jgi:hypothetical protein
LIATHTFLCPSFLCVALLFAFAFGRLWKTIIFDALMRSFHMKIKIWRKSNKMEIHANIAHVLYYLSITFYHLHISRHKIFAQMKFTLSLLNLNLFAIITLLSKIENSCNCLASAIFSYCCSVFATIFGTWLLWSHFRTHNISTSSLSCYVLLTKKKNNFITFWYTRKAIAAQVSC